MTAPNLELQPTKPHAPHPGEVAQVNVEEVEEYEPDSEASLADAEDAVTQIERSTNDAVMAVENTQLSQPEKSRLKEIWQKMREATTNFFQKIRGIFGKEEIPDVTDALEEVPSETTHPEASKDAEKIYFMTDREPGRDQVLIDDEGRQIHFYDPENPNAVEVLDPSGTHQGKGTISQEGRLTRVRMEGSPFFFTVGEGEVQAVNQPLESDPALEEALSRPVADTGVRPPLSTITLEQDTEKPAEEMSFKKALSRAQELLQDTESVLAPEDRTALETAIANISTEDAGKKADNALVILDIVKKADSYPPGLEDADFSHAVVEEEAQQPVSKQEQVQVKNPEDRRQFLDTRLQAVNAYSEKFMQQLKALDINGGLRKELTQKFIDGQIDEQDFEKLLKFQGSNTEKHNAAVNAMQETYNTMMSISNTPYQEGARFDVAGKQYKVEAVKKAEKPVIPVTPEIQIDVDKVQPREMPAAADTTVFGQDRLGEDDDAGGAVEEEQPITAPQSDNVENLNDHRPARKETIKENQYEQSDTRLKNALNTDKHRFLTTEQIAAIRGEDFSLVQFAYNETNQELVITDKAGNYLTHLDHKKTRNLLTEEIIEVEDLRRFTKAYGEEEVKAVAA